MVWCFTAQSLSILELTVDAVDDAEAAWAAFVDSEFRHLNEGELLHALYNDIDQFSNYRDSSFTPAQILRTTVWVSVLS